MLPTIEVVGDMVLIDKGYRRGRGVVVGDVVSFDSVVQPGERVIKRVVGMEGDFVGRDTPGMVTGVGGGEMLMVCNVVLCCCFGFYLCLLAGLLACWLSHPLFLYIQACIHSNIAHSYPRRGKTLS